VIPARRVVRYVVSQTLTQVVAQGARPADGASTHVTHGQQATQVAVTCDRV
jgi:hypothetical protein